MSRKVHVFTLGSSIIALILIWEYSGDRILSTVDTQIDSRSISGLSSIDFGFGIDLNRSLDLLDLWDRDPSCNEFPVILLPDGERASVAFVSFPGSGNTWIRAVLMGLTGIYINSIYTDENDIFVSKAGARFNVPPDCSCTLMTKTHDFSLDFALEALPFHDRFTELNKFQSRGILLIRDPYKAIVSYRNFAYGGMQGLAPETAFEGQDWDTYVARSVAAWQLLATVWISGIKEGGIVYYERIRKNPEPELRRLAKILGIDPLDEERLQCVLQHLNDNSFRRTDHGHYNITHRYTASQKLLIYEAIEHVNAALRNKNLQELPVEYYSINNKTITEFGKY